MHSLALLFFFSATPMENTLQLGKLTIRFKQSVAATTVRCEIQTKYQGEPTRVRTAEFEASADFPGCFTVPAMQKTPGYFMVREMVRDTPHTVLIAQTGAVVDVDEMLVHSSHWDLVAAGTAL